VKRFVAIAVLLWGGVAHADATLAPPGATVPAATPTPSAPTPSAPTPSAPTPSANEGEATDDALFSAATTALHDGRPADAIADLESLGDRGVVDPVVSYDRGVAYVERVRAGGEQPGDLGRAAQGFEEARDLTSDRSLAEDATKALGVVRAEVARRRARAGESAAIEQGPSLGRAFVRLVPEDAWTWLAAVASLGLATGLFVRRFAASRRARIGGTLAAAAAAPLLVLLGCATAFARDDRLHLREGVVVVASTRPSDERGVVLTAAATLPEAARVEIIGSRAGWARIRWGTLDAWVPAQAVRPLSRRGAS
jgi:hypothetical protein